MSQIHHRKMEMQQHVFLFAKVRKNLSPDRKKMKLIIGTSYLLPLACYQDICSKKRSVIKLLWKHICLASSAQPFLTKINELPEKKSIVDKQDGASCIQKNLSRFFFIIYNFEHVDVFFGSGLAPDSHVLANEFVTMITLTMDEMKQTIWERGPAG